MRILALSGSLREHSYNSAVARAAAELAPAGVEVEVFEGLGDVPLYDAGLDLTAGSRRASVICVTASPMPTPSSSSRRSTTAPSPAC